MIRLSSMEHFSSNKHASLTELLVGEVKFSEFFFLYESLWVDFLFRALL